ncbi:unnamed protein product [Mytilus coruscus]|uniref:Zinc finger PHD-type domain-containing protein n=1 Tax=Mytilus coruscus TaxID=42192 RepID=A0A6J8A879_MYTCO|nr:unnamed protein product [Mytilus coruscus]
MELATRTSARNKVKPSIFTPSKYENFSLNKRKAMDKKLEQCNRQADILLMYKHENYILELSLAAYELLKLAMTEYFANHNIYKIQAKDQKDKHGLCTRTSYSVINLNSNKQQYRINLFHTTSRIEVNGRGRQEFLPHLQDIAASMDRKGNCPQLNKLLEQQIKQCIESMQTSGEASLVTHTQDNDLKASGDASLVRTSQLRQKPASGDALLAGSQQSSGDASLVKTSQPKQKPASGDASLVKTSQPKQKPASGDASLAGLQQSSGDASLVKTSQLRQKPASGDASLAGFQQSSGDASLTENLLVGTPSLAGSQQSSKDALLDKASSQSQSLSAHQANGDASLVKTSQLRQKPAGGDASLAGSQQSSKDALLDKASRDALLAIKTYERGILHQSSSGDASLEKILQSSQNPASRDALLPGQQQSSGDASLDKSTELNMTNTDNSWDNLLMILCSICAKSVNGLVTPTYFCCRCEQTMHAHCEKDRVANVEDMNNDYICFTCTQMDQTMSNSQENNRAETTVNHTAAKKIERHVQGKQQLLSLKKTPS